MAEQRSMSQAAHQTVDVTAGNTLARVADELGSTSAFVGYERTSSAASNVLAIVLDGESVEEAPEGSKVDVILDVTPFYAESGGQVGDNGTLHAADGAELRVDDVQKAGGGLRRSERHNLHLRGIGRNRRALGERRYVQAQPIQRSRGVALPCDHRFNWVCVHQQSGKY